MKKEKENGERKERGEPLKRKEEGGQGWLAHRTPTGAAWADARGEPAALQSLTRRGRSRRAAEWKGSRALSHWSAAGRPRGHWAT